MSRKSRYSNLPEILRIDVRLEREISLGKPKLDALGRRESVLVCIFDMNKLWLESATSLEKLNALGCRLSVSVDIFAIDESFL